MKKSMDTIQFESRYEVQAITLALMGYLKEHPNDEKAPTVRELIDKLDVMDMEW